MSDPLSGERNKIAGGEMQFLTGTGKPTVKKGDVFPLRAGYVEVGKVENEYREGERGWKARLILHRPETARIPAQQQGSLHPSQYVSSRHGALDGVSEEVPEDYQELLAEEGRQKTALAGAAGRERERISRETRKGGNHSQAFIARAQRRLDAA